MLSTTFYKSCAAHVPTPRNTSILKMFNQIFYTANEFNSFLQLPLLTQHGTDLFFPTFVVRNYKRSLFLEKYYHWITISTSTRSWYRFFLPRNFFKKELSKLDKPSCLWWQLFNLLHKPVPRMFHPLDNTYAVPSHLKNAHQSQIQNKRHVPRQSTPLFS